MRWWFRSVVRFRSRSRANLLPAVWVYLCESKENGSDSEPSAAVMGKALNKYSGLSGTTTKSKAYSVDKRPAGGSTSKALAQKARAQVCFDRLTLSRQRIVVVRDGTRPN